MENNELEQMKAQMAALEKKIADQEIVNERLISKSMKDKMSWIKRYIVAEIVAIPLAAIIWIGISRYANIPLWFTLIFIVGAIIDVYYDWKINVTPIKENDFCRQNLIETAEKLRKMKRLRTIQTTAGIVLVMTFFFTIAVYVYFHNIKGINVFDITSNHNATIIGGFVGLIIGSIVGAILTKKLHSKMQRSNDDIIRQIEEMEKEG